LRNLEDFKYALWSENTVLCDSSLPIISAKDKKFLVFCPLFLWFSRRAVSWNRQDCNRQSIQRVQNTWPIGTGLFLNAGTQM